MTHYRLSIVIIRNIGDKEEKTKLFRYQLATNNPICLTTKMATNQNGGRWPWQIMNITSILFIPRSTRNNRRGNIIQWTTRKWISEAGNCQPTNLTLILTRNLDNRLKLQGMLTVNSEYEGHHPYDIHPKKSSITPMYPWPGKISLQKHHPRTVVEQTTKHWCGKDHLVAYNMGLHIWWLPQPAASRQRQAIFQICHSHKDHDRPLWSTTEERSLVQTPYVLHTKMA